MSARIGWLIAACSFLGVFALFAVCIALMSGTTTSAVSREQVEAGVVETCQKAIRNKLKDPDSAQFSSWKSFEMTRGTPGSGLNYQPEFGDKFYRSSGMANAKNSFGGYVGNQAYTCDAVVGRDGTVTAQAELLADSP